MKIPALFFSRTPTTNPNPPEPNPHCTGETSGGGVQTLPSDGDGGATAETADETPLLATASGERRRELMEMPPSDDVCPICFGNFNVPCRAPCGHWYCGSCILQYWKFSAALQPCKCPICSQRINKLMPEASMYGRSEVEISRVIKNVGDYNRLFVGGISGFVLKFLAIPLYIKRIFREMLNADRPGLYLHEMRLIALLLGILYSFSPFDFLRLGRRNIIDVFDYSAFSLSFILYAVGVYVRRRRLRNVRELAEMQAGRD